MNNYVDMAEKLALEKKLAKKKKKSENERVKNLNLENLNKCRKLVKDGLKQWNGKYGLKYVEEKNPIGSRYQNFARLEMSGEPFIDILIYWDKWEWWASDDCCVDSDGPKIEVKHHKEYTESYSEYLGYRAKQPKIEEFRSTNGKDTAEQFLTYFAESMVKFI